MTKPSTSGRQLLPLSVWLCADEQPERDQATTGCPRRNTLVGIELARHLITACTKPGELIVETHPINAATLACAALQARKAIALVPKVAHAQAIRAQLQKIFPAKELTGVRLRPCSPQQMDAALAKQAGAARLVIYAPPCHSGRQCPACPESGDSANERPAVMRGAWQVLGDGGHLAVVTAPHREGEQLYDQAPALIRAARAVGFAYTQHVIALRVPVREGELVVQAAPEGLGHLYDVRRPAPPVTVGVHADVLLFTKVASDGGTR
ncbi:hypothetical protein IMZ11_26730 [Microtetraspora sp. AC03309]|uniref:hypothetical protein n=1 Tax=Microtetraspora sp. AC03309 TaxID=2779376 RepID=UPI001E45A2F2|nr:hypothetical protein [Microtetraspora sp. AC03309]MCC5579228.1 hypothetical protein [Microtetraspora sp. AC03309]